MRPLLVFSSKYVLGLTELLGDKLNGQGFFISAGFSYKTAFLLTVVEILCKTLLGKTYMLIQRNLLDATLGPFFYCFRNSSFYFRSHFSKP